MAGASSPSSSAGPGGGVAGSGTGWAHEIPLGPPPGVAVCDRLMDARDAGDKAERIAQEAQVQAVRKAMVP
jgi:hypothetical protein